MSDSRMDEGHLIDLVRENPCLYQKKHKDFKSRVVKENVWTAIGAVLMKSGKECRDAWKPLRQQYLAFRRKLDNPTGSGSNGRPFFRHEKAMEFCHDSAEDSEIPNFTNVNNTGLDSELFSFAQVDIFESSEVREAEGPGDIVPEMPHVVATPSIAQQKETALPIGSSRPHVKNPGTSKRTLDQELLKALKEGNPELDEYDMFCGSIAAKLRRLGGKNMSVASEAQLKIHQLVFELEKSVE